jgi:diguanylate cyclase (GGDEF)-like protein
VLAAVLAAPLLSVLAGACALAAGTWTVLLLSRVRKAEREAAGSAALARALDGTPGPARGLIDHDTGLPDGRFFALTVDNRVAAGRRRLWPVTVVLLQLDAGPRSLGHLHRQEALRAFALAVRQTLRDADVACRTGETSFGLVLDDTSEEGGVWAAERLQLALAPDTATIRRLAAGVASYPNHGLRSEEVTAAAHAALTRACTLGGGRALGRVEVAQPDFA